MYDVIIIGAGISGLTASIYTARSNLKTLVLEKETMGGQISSSPLVQNYPGYMSISGQELSDIVYEQALSFGVQIELEEVMNIIPGDIITIKTDMNTYQTKALIIATGAKYKLLGINNEIDLIGKGIHFCVSCDGAFYKDKEVAIIGGANSAVTNAIYMSNIASKVYLVYRGSSLKCEQYLIDKVNSINNIEVIYNTNVSVINGVNELESIVLDNSETLNINGMFISVGMIPNTSLLSELVGNDGYYDSNDTKTKYKNIFVSGDNRTKELRQLTTASSDGSIAATNVINHLK